VIIINVFLVFGAFVAMRPNNGAQSTSVNVTTSTVTSVAIVVPNVIGMSLNSAETELTTLRFTFVIVSGCTGRRVQSGDVAAQGPSAGSSAVQGSSVRLVTPPKSCP
jgi:beta-lactam-binding protein with PASTA domain